MALRRRDPRSDALDADIRTECGEPLFAPKPLLLTPLNGVATPPAKYWLMNTCPASMSRAKRSALVMSAVLDAGDEPEGRRVPDGDRLLGRIDHLDGENRPENLLLRNRIGDG